MIGNGILALLGWWILRHINSIHLGRSETEFNGRRRSYQIHILFPNTQQTSTSDYQVDALSCTKYKQTKKNITLLELSWAHDSRKDHSFVPNRASMHWCSLQSGALHVLHIRVAYFIFFTLHALHTEQRRCLIFTSLHVSERAWRTAWFQKGSSSVPNRSSLHWCSLQSGALQVEHIL